MIVRLGEGDNKVLRWARKAASTHREPVREVLKGVSVEHKKIVGSDGFRLHAAQVTGMEEAEGQVVRLDRLLAKDTTVSAEPIDEKFPDYHVLLPKGEAVFEIRVDGDLLADAVKGMGWVKLRFHGPTRPIEAFGKMDEYSTYALIMPMSDCGYNSHNGIDPWRP